MQPMDKGGVLYGLGITVSGVGELGSGQSFSAYRRARQGLGSGFCGSLTLKGITS